MRNPLKEQKRCSKSLGQNLSKIESNSGFKNIPVIYVIEGGRLARLARWCPL